MSDGFSLHDLPTAQLTDIHHKLTTAYDAVLEWGQAYNNQDKAIVDKLNVPVSMIFDGVNVELPSFYAAWFLFKGLEHIRDEMLMIELVLNRRGVRYGNA